MSHNRRRQRDAELVACERANAMRDRRHTEWQKVLDEDYKVIYQRAAARLAKIFANKDHYIHQKAPRHLGKQTKQYKKQLVSQCRRPWTSPQHRWEPRRSGFQCGACGVRVHQALTVPVIEERLSQECPQLSIEAHQVDQPSHHEPLAKKLTSATCLNSRRIHLRQQDQHSLEETTGYLRCAKCGCSVHKHHKRINETASQPFIQAPCLDKPHGGHASHVLRQKGERVTCRQCGLNLQLDADERVHRCHQEALQRFRSQWIAAASRKSSRDR